MGVGKWTVPWISTRARPEGVWSSGGRGFSVGGALGERDGMWMGIDGIVACSWNGHCWMKSEAGILDATRWSFGGAAQLHGGATASR